MRVSEWMSTDLVVVRANDPLEAAIVQMDRHAVRHLLVMDHERCVGVLSDRDLLEATGWSTRRARGAPPDSELVRDVMSSSLETAAAIDDFADACRRMFERHIGCLPVLDSRGHPLGIVTERDALRAFQHLRRTENSNPILDPTLSRVMSRDLLTVSVDLHAKEAFERARQDGVRHLCVTYDGWFVGLVSDRDLRLCVGRGEAELRKLGDIMSKEVISLPPDAPLSRAVDTLVQYRFSAIPVLEERKLVGLVTTSNVLARLARYLDSTGELDAVDAVRG